LALDRSTGILYIADFNGNRIRKLTPDGMISTHAGDGVDDFVNGPASTARFRSPRGVAVDSAGIVYVSDYYNHCIRKVADNTVSTLAGVCGTSGFNDGSGSSALFNQPAGLTLDKSGSLFVAGNSDGRIRKIVISSMGVSTFAGRSTMGYTNGQGTTARFNYPYDVAFNSSGYLFVADKDNHMIRVISPSGYVSLFAGSSSGLLDGQGAAAMFSSPEGLAFDDNGNLYVAEYYNPVIRKVSPSGYVKSLTNSKGLLGDQSGPALKSSFWHPTGIEVDGNGTIYVADDYSNKIKIICNMTCINGVADCFGHKCKCDIGWTGDNCGTLIPTSSKKQD
jgi:sugar lactone lactonase YvrE